MEKSVLRHWLPFGRTSPRRLRIQKNIATVPNTSKNPVYNIKTYILKLPIKAYVATRIFRLTKGKYHIPLLQKQPRINSKSISFSFFFTARTDIWRAGVQYILDSVVDALQDNPQRR